VEPVQQPEVIHYTLDVLAAFIGPLFRDSAGGFLPDQKQQIDVDALFNDGPTGRYYYSGGVNWTAVKALIPATLMGVAITFTPVLQPMANFAWFTGCFLGGALFFVLAKREQVQRSPAGHGGMTQAGI
jgi:NCS1 family nucleobase:cation symporter-1